MNAPAISVSGLLVRRGDFTLQVDDWTAPAGACVAIVGANGAGKSTFLSAVSGRLGSATTSGRVTLLGRDLREWDHRLSDVLGVLPHAPIGLGFMRVMEYLELCAASHEAWDAELAGRLIEEMELKPRARLDELSEGSRRKFGLACLEAAGPPVLFLDEPTASLDIAARRTMLRAITESRVRQPQRTIVLASHEPSDVLALADRVDLLIDGRFARSSAMPSRAEAQARAAVLEDILGTFDRKEPLSA